MKNISDLKVFIRDCLSKKMTPSQILILSNIYMGRPVLEMISVNDFCWLIYPREKEY